MHAPSLIRQARYLDLSSELTDLRAELTRSKDGVEKAMAEAQARTGKQKAWHAERRELIRALASEQKRRDKAARGSIGAASSPPTGAGGAVTPPRGTVGAGAASEAALEGGLVGGLLRNLGGLLPTRLGSAPTEGRGVNHIAAPPMLGSPNAVPLPAPPAGLLRHA